MWPIIGFFLLFNKKQYVTKKDLTLKHKVFNMEYNKDLCWVPSFTDKYQ